MMNGASFTDEEKKTIYDFCREVYELLEELENYTGKVIDAEGGIIDEDFDHCWRAYDEDKQVIANMIEIAKENDLNKMRELLVAIRSFVEATHNNGYVGI